MTAAERNRRYRRRRKAGKRCYMLKLDEVLTEEMLTEFGISYDSDRPETVTRALERLWIFLGTGDLPAE